MLTFINHKPKSNSLIFLRFISPIIKFPDFSKKQSILFTNSLIFPDLWFYLNFSLIFLVCWNPDKTNTWLRGWITLNGQLQNINRADYPYISSEYKQTVSDILIKWFVLKRERFLPCYAVLPMIWPGERYFSPDWHQYFRKIFYKFNQ